MCRLERMEFCKTREVCHLLIDSRVVLHCAGAERIESVVDSVRSLGKSCVVSAHLVLRDFRKMYFSLAELVLSRKCYRYIACREDILSSTRNALLEY